ncbi:MAG: 23S rRNA (adenine(2030)-N(6))-methyltransferase RlmJ [Cephaloticoccus sp.]|nr:23S rRNA (adenine(2030)-N(6))-methyltransferase RlmJ [Cephaloticoccus sp.]MCF7759998.1 23S rRNA (adenine(2030)-N(6))-methyltransferase RlmJ [Cephaloticoccus sp.]
MNYRHHFHAGNFADVIKHALVVRLVAALQRKEKGFLYLDTHAGRGSYDLTTAEQGDSLARTPEWPAGVGRLWSAAGLPDLLADYVAIIRRHDQQQGNLTGEPRFYPGSPVLVAALLRPQDRMALCERHSDECAALRANMGLSPRCVVQAMDGYVAIRAMLPPVEKRALVLIDPPYEAEHEFADIVRGVKEGLARLPGAVIAIWYPFTKRARVDAFFNQLRALDLPPTAVAELAVAGEFSALKMRGCGVVIINPPWQFEAEAAPALTNLANILAQEPGATGRYWWLVPER